VSRVDEHVSGFGIIRSGSISIGPGGLVVDGKNSSTFSSLEDLEDLNVLLGSGVSGSVRKVLHRQSGKFYAVKTMLLENSHEFLEKKLVELKTLHHSSHPCIVSFYGAFYNDAALSFVLEYMDRGTLADLLTKCHVIQENILSKLTYKVVLGLEYLHKEMHLIHRDIKPQNILINREGDVKITDFGVSGEIAHTAAFANTFVGTLKYMSPERIKGNAHSANSDIWALGLVIMECAIGVFPYKESVSFFELLRTIVDAEAPKPPDTFSPEFSDFIAKCLQKVDTDRSESSALLLHPWVTKFDQDGINIKEWLEMNTLT